MVAEPGAAAAAAIAAECPQLDVGLHLVACNGRSVLPARQLRGIVDASGRFPTSESWAGLHYSLRRSLRSKLRDEFRAQIERHLQLVGRVYHIDGHHHIHTQPALAEIVIELAAEYHVPCLRMVREPLRPALALSHDHWPRKLRDHLVYRWLTRRMERRLPALGIRSNDCLFGLHETGRLSERYVLDVLAHLPRNAVTEFYFHPAIDAAGEPPMWPSQKIEAEILTSPSVRAAIQKLGIRLMTFRELAEMPVQHCSGGV